jgi:hypothetical protein
MILNAWLKVKEIQFMNQFSKPRKRYPWKDIAVAVPCVLGVLILAVSLSLLFLEAGGPECLVVHCVKVIR